MTSTRALLSTLDNRFSRWWHRVRIAGIEATRPLDLRPAPLCFVSQLRHRDVRMYLVAIKSVYRRVGEGAIVVLDNGSLTAADRRLLKHHLSAPRILPIDAVETGRCPQGGTWERLLTIADLCRGLYVIQVDADLLALSPLDEVVAAYRRNVAFTLAGGRDSRWCTAAEASAFVSTHTGTHVQIAAERVLASLPGADLRYVRGCSGFAGFSRASVAREQLEAFSVEMESRLGAKWREWGSEQVASNFVVANRPGAVLLPWPRYMSHTPATAHQNCALVHFYGSYRYANGRYTALSTAFVKGLKSVGASAAVPA